MFSLRLHGFSLPVLWLPHTVQILNIWLIEITLFFATKVSVDFLTALPQETAYDNGPRHFKSEIDLIDAQTGAGLESDPLQSELVVLGSRFGRRNMMKLRRNRRNGGPKGG